MQTGKKDVLDDMQTDNETYKIKDYNIFVFDKRKRMRNIIFCCY